MRIVVAGGVPRSAGMMDRGAAGAGALTLPFIASHLDYMLHELLKNAMRYGCRRCGMIDACMPLARGRCMAAQR